MGDVPDRWVADFDMSINMMNEAGVKTRHPDTRVRIRIQIQLLCTMGPRP